MYPVFRALLLFAAAAPSFAEVTDRFTRILAIAPGAPISLEVTVGDVRVSSWNRPDVAVEILRRAPDALRLEQIPARVDQTAGGGLRIRAAQTDEGRDAALRTDVVLRVPQDSHVGEIAVFEGQLELSGLGGVSTARVERGDIVANDISGTIRLETAIGDIRVDGATLSADGLVRLRTFNGDVTLVLTRRPSDARILALSLGGTITSDIPLTHRERWGPRFGEATLGKGEPVISIDVVTGNVAIRVSSGGR